MRKIGFNVSNRGVTEVLPKTYKISNKPSQRRMFLTLLNKNLPKEMQFCTKSQRMLEENLYTIFLHKIASYFGSLSLRPHTPTKVTKIYKADSLLFNHFFATNADYFHRFKGVKVDKSFQMRLGYEHPAAKLISMIFNGKEMKLLMDLDAFLNKPFLNALNQVKVPL